MTPQSTAERRAPEAAQSPKLITNAIVECDIRAYDLSGHRRAHIAKQIRCCLYGKTLCMNIDIDGVPAIS